MNRLEEKASLVTGGASGIGRAITLRLAEEGASVTIADIREEPREGGKPTHELIEERDGEARFVKTDISEVEQIEEAIEKTLGEFGTFDVMVNNAGVYPGLVPVEDIDERDYQKIMEINLKGTDNHPGLGKHPRR